jgi:Response regulator containing CheY-like receiver, AAA-type ATPase, and DNA-binding domains
MRAIDPAQLAAATANATAAEPSPAAALAPATEGALQVPFGVPLRILERQIIEATIDHCGGSIPKAAAMLEVSPSTIYRKKEGWEKEA